MSLDSYGDDLVALSYGVFPRNVKDYQNSRDPFLNAVFIDYQLHLALLREELPHALLLDQIAYAHDRLVIPLLKCYAAVVRGHILYCTNDFQGAHYVLSNTEVPEDDWGLMARYSAIKGQVLNAGHEVWADFLFNTPSYGSSTQLMLNHWYLQNVIYLAIFLTNNGSSALTFGTLQRQQFASNLSSLVAASNILLRRENAHLLASTFKADYASLLAKVLADSCKQKQEFPNASDDSVQELNLVRSLYETLNAVSPHRLVVRLILPSHLSKNFLINMASKTFQSRTVLYNLVLALLDLNEYDEAFAAAKTYIGYLNKEIEQLEKTPDIIEAVEFFSICIDKFNPLNSYSRDAKFKDKKFRYVIADTIHESLHNFASLLVSYLEQVADITQLSFETDPTDELSFLYTKGHLDAPLHQDSRLLSSLSKAWSCLGRYHYYLAVHRSSDERTMSLNKDKLTDYLKKALNVNATSSLQNLFDYAYILAQSGLLSSALKLCKFILKRWPESYKTWNLLVLVLSALEHRQEAESTEVMEDLESPETPVSALEKYIGDALNIAGIHMLRVKDSDAAMSLQVKYAILQLKMTQLAVIELKHGIHHISESIVEVFLLFRELFPYVDVKSEGNDAENRADSLWSHRPAVIDPSGDPEAAATVTGSKSREKSAARANIKKLSKVTESVRPGHESKKSEQSQERSILQDIWLWTAKFYTRLGKLEEAEECIVAAETVFRPNVKTFTFFGMLTSKSRNLLSLQEYEKSLEAFHDEEYKYDKQAYGSTLSALSQLFLEEGSSLLLFTSEKDLDAGLLRLRNYLASYKNCWPYGYNNAESWYYLSVIYEKFDDPQLQSDALWKCVGLEEILPVRPYHVCEDFTL